MEELAIYDPFGRTAVFFPAPRDFSWVLYYTLLIDEADASFQVVAVDFFDDCVKGAVFCSRTREWSPLPTLPVRSPWNARDGVRDGCFAYWQSNTRKYYDSIDKERILVLDTAAMEWLLTEVPFPIGESYCAADMAEYGGLCLVGAKEQCLQLWASRNGKWEMKKQVSLLQQFPFLKKIRCEEWMRRVRPLAVRGDYVFMEFWSIRKPDYLLLLNLKTMNLEMVVKNNSTARLFRVSVFPFFMSWSPPFLSPGV